MFHFAGYISTALFPSDRHDVIDGRAKAKLRPPLLYDQVGFLLGWSHILLQFLTINFISARVALFLIVLALYEIICTLPGTYPNFGLILSKVA